MRPQVQPAWDEFERASAARRKDLHSATLAGALTAARAALERSLDAVLERVPYRTRRVGDPRPGRDGGHVHLALVEDAAIGDWRRVRGQTLCGAAPGRPAGDRPVTCAACLRLLDRHVDAEPNPPELGLF
jgi:hypothetical protein